MQRVTETPFHIEGTEYAYRRPSPQTVRALRRLGEALLLGKQAGLLTTLVALIIAGNQHFDGSPVALVTGLAVLVGSTALDGALSLANLGRNDLAEADTPALRRLKDVLAHNPDQQRTVAAWMLCRPLTHRDVRKIRDLIEHHRWDVRTHREREREQKDHDQLVAEMTRPAHGDEPAPAPRTDALRDRDSAATSGP